MPHDTEQRETGPFTWPSRRFVPFFVALTLLGVALGVRLCGGSVAYAMLVVAVDGLGALFVVAPAILLGFCLLPLFRLEPLPFRWRFILAAALGLGATSLLVLALGLAGVLQRSLWIVLLGIFTLAGALQLRRSLARCASSVPSKPGASRHARIPIAWLLVSPFLSLALLSAVNAPGFIWREEGYAYDVLEYHLQIPKEYHQAGEIEYLPHNVYANFPANVEMLYLLAMILSNDEVEVGVTANMIHLLLAALTVAAVWVAARDCSPSAGRIAAVVMASAGWLGYLSGLAYVENGMLFFGAVATAIILRLVRNVGQAFPDAAGASYDDAPCDPVSPAAPGRLVVLAGVVAGFCAGCKYTAVPLIVIPLAAAMFFVPVERGRQRIANVTRFILVAIVTMSPWLVKNQIMTGNPVFPLANARIDASPPAWGPEETARWDRGHAPPTGAALSSRLNALWNRVLWDRHHRMGPALFVLAFGGLLWRRRDHADRLLISIVAIQLGVWLFATHLYARFAVVLLIPLALLCGFAHRGTLHRRRGRVVWALVLLGAAWNFAFAARLHAQESPGGAPASVIYQGRLPEYEYFDVVNSQLPQDARLLLVGDAKAFYFERDVDYCVVFNRNPFVDAIRASRNDQQLINWLHDRGYTHVLVNWSEIARLSSTYGFAEEVNRALFDRLEGHGLTAVREFDHPVNRTPHITLYECAAE